MLKLQDAETIANWAFKVAIAFEYVAAAEPSSPSVRGEFFRTRTVPDHAAVALGMASLTYANALYGVRSADLTFIGAPIRIFTLLLRHVLSKCPTVPLADERLTHSIYFPSATEDAPRSTQPATGSHGSPIRSSATRTPFAPSSRASHHSWSNIPDHHAAMLASDLSQTETKRTLWKSGPASRPCSHAERPRWAQTRSVL